MRVNKSTTHEDLINLGFTYREHYNNYMYMIFQPETKRALLELKEMGYSQEKAREETFLKRTYIDYCIQIDLKKRTISVFAHALKDYPHEESLYHYDIPSEVFKFIHELNYKDIITI